MLERAIEKHYFIRLLLNTELCVYTQFKYSYDLQGDNAFLNNHRGSNKNLSVTEENFSLNFWSRVP